ncbi:hypothetical protein [Blastococcus sp. SYSU D00695]
MAVVGAPAVGKTLLARLLEERLGLRHVELDRLRFRAPGPASDAEFAAAVARETRPDQRWVVEGAETGPPVVAVWRGVDLLVWLDHRRPAVAWRVLGDCLPALVSGGPAGRWGYCRYQGRKLRKSFRHARRLRSALPRELAAVREAGVPVVRLRSRRATRRWLDGTVPGGGRGTLT